MLIFVDQEKHVRVVRVHTAEGGASRTPLGRIPKKQIDLPDDLRVLLTDEEAQQAEAVIALYRRAVDVQSECHALNFAAITREVMDRFETTASEVERQVVMSALMEAVRRMRRFEKSIEAAG